MSLEVLPHHVLLVEDNGAFAEAMALALEESVTRPWQVTCCGTLAEASAWLTQYEPTVILLDLNLPDSQHIQTFDRLLEMRRGIPIVVITVLGGADIEGHIVSQGMWYVDKYVIGCDPAAFVRDLEAFLTPVTSNTPEGRAS